MPNVVRAIDTSALIRFLTKDDQEQYAKARALIERGDIFVATTVLLEGEWVLRSGYGYARMEIISALPSFGGLPGVRLENPHATAQYSNEPRPVWILRTLSTSHRRAEAAHFTPLMRDLSGLPPRISKCSNPDGRVAY